MSQEAVTVKRSSEAFDSRSREAVRSQRPVSRSQRPVSTEALKDVDIKIPGSYDEEQQTWSHRDWVFMSPRKHNREM